MPILLARFSPLLLSVAAWLLGTAHTAAQPMGKTVVIPFSAGESDTSALNLARNAEALLRARRIALIPLHDARDRFASRSRPPQTICSYPYRVYCLED